MEAIFETFEDPMTLSKIKHWHRYYKGTVFLKILSLKCINEADV